MKTKIKGETSPKIKTNLNLDKEKKKPKWAPRGLSRTYNLPILALTIYLGFET